MRYSILLGILLAACSPNAPTLKLEVDEGGLRYRVHILSSHASDLVYSPLNLDTTTELNPHGFSLVFRDNAGNVVPVYGNSEWVPFTIDSNFFPAATSIAELEAYAFSGRSYPTERLTAATRRSSAWYPLKGAIVGAMRLSDFKTWYEMQIRFVIDAEPQALRSESRWIAIPRDLIDEHRHWAEDPQGASFLPLQLNAEE